MDSNIEIDASPWDDVPELSLKKTLFTDAWLRQISIGKILGIALLVVIDLEPLHLPVVLEADPTQEPGTPRGNVQWYLFSSPRAE